MTAVRPLLLLICLIAFLSAHAQPPQGTEQSPQQNRLNQVGLTQRIGNPLPDTAMFRNARGETIGLTALAALHPLILVPAWFDCPHLCPMLLDNLAEATAALPFAAEEYRVAVVSIDPRATQATATKLAQRLRERHGRITANWQLLTGNAAAVETLTRALGFHYSYDAERASYAHPAAVVIVASGGVVSRYLLRLDPRQPDLRLALVDAGRGRLGNPVDQLLLRCYHFDPQNGRYTFAVVRLLQIVGSLFVLALIAFVLGARRRERL